LKYIFFNLLNNKFSTFNILNLIWTMRTRKIINISHNRLKDLHKSSWRYKLQTTENSLTLNFNPKRNARNNQTTKMLYVFLAIKLVIFFGNFFFEYEWLNRLHLQQLLGYCFHLSKDPYNLFCYWHRFEAP